MNSLSHSLRRVFVEFFIQEGFKEIKAQTSFSINILESLNDICWWNNRRSLFLVTDFLLTLLLIDIACRAIVP